MYIDEPNPDSGQWGNQESDNTPEWRDAGSPKPAGK
jgi:hypothetical protein